jgi:RimJ/RimL family protein N-acetyltransferase
MVTRRVTLGRMRSIAPPTLCDGEVGVRPLAEGDVEAIVRACADPEISRWTRVPQPYTPEDARRFIAVAATEAAAGLSVALAVTDDHGRLLGTVGLMEVDRCAGRGEIGYWLAREARGRGAATRAVRLLAEWAARELGLGRLEILVQRANAASVRVAERAGFAPSGELRRLERMPPGRRDSYAVHVWSPE